MANQWWELLVNYGGYHGYGSANFMQGGMHLGAGSDCQQLSSALHKSGMYLIHDIVVNHTGDFFACQGGWNPANPARYWVRNKGSVPVTASTQSPFNFDDPADPARQAAAIYHRTPDICNVNDAIRPLPASSPLRKRRDVPRFTRSAKASQRMVERSRCMRERGLGVSKLPRYGPA